MYSPAPAMTHSEKMKARRERLLYPSGPELEFARIMGCAILPLPFTYQRKTGKPAVLIVMRGVMRRENVEREVLARGYFIDFGNDIRRGIEIDGPHHNVIDDAIRDEHLAKGGWQILHIPASQLYTEPERVRRAATIFLTK